MSDQKPDEVCEALKIALKQEAEGILVTFRIQPEHLPAALLLGRIPSRWALAMVEIDDDEKPKPSPKKEAADKKRQNANVMRAAILSEDPQFKTFLKQKYPKQWNANMGGPDTLRAVLGIDSRKKLATDDEALLQWDRLQAEYEMWKRGE